MKKTIILLAVSLCFGCGSKSEMESSDNDSKKIEVKDTKKLRISVLHVYNMGGMSEERMATLVSNRKSIYPHVLYDGEIYL